MGMLEMVETPGAGPSHQHPRATADLVNAYRKMDLNSEDGLHVGTATTVDMLMDSESWAGSMPAPQGLYRGRDEEKDACGVGFVCHIKGKPSHKIVSDARQLLCNMTHRGAAIGADGDGAGAMSGIPHNFFVRETTMLGFTLPPPSTYAVGNLFFKPNDPDALAEHKRIFEETAAELGLRVLGYRKVPVDNTILGPSALSREPLILQPFVVLASYYGSGTEPATTDASKLDVSYFERQLYVLRKSATHKITLARWFYVCSLSNRNIVYKGQLAPVQVYQYYHDLQAAEYSSHFCLVHSRFSTNTFPSWDRAQPMRYAAHNGEINTLRGNKNNMRAREGNLQSKEFGDELKMLFPIVEAGGSDSAAFDNVLELLIINKVLTLPQAVMMMVPEAWQENAHMDAEKMAFYQWAACLMEPWDGPALFTFSDGRYCGANLDRNGLRPCRYYVTNDDVMICASEVGTMPIATNSIIKKGRLQPGKMLLVDTVEGRIVDDQELKYNTARSKPFSTWLEANLIHLPSVIRRVRDLGEEPVPATFLDEKTISEDTRLMAFGYTTEQLNLLILPMIADGKEALGSMGNDAPLACMSNVPRLIYDYFKQLFAQVTNPPIDPIRESIVMSLECYVGPEGNLLTMSPGQTHRLCLPSPILDLEELNAVTRMTDVHRDWPSRTIDITFDKEEGLAGYPRALDRICNEASKAITDGIKVIILSDRKASAERVPISSLIATGGVHHHLIRNKDRSKLAIMVETGEAREVHHMCVLLGYGADAICPWLMMEAIYKLKRENLIKKDMSDDQIINNYKHSIDSGILKVMSKMGISTLHSYKGAQIFESLGLDDSVVSRCFDGTASRIKGATFAHLALDAFEFHERAWPSREVLIPPGLPESGEYHWRDGGEAHINDPTGIANLQDAVREKNQAAYDAYARNAQEQIKRVTLRGLLDFDYSKSRSISIDQVEPWTEIVRRFCTGAMSYGSISMEAHSALAIALNRLGGKSNTGEGGEDAERSLPMPNGDSMRSAIKQIASGRFGVTSNYLADADELQIKMAQGAKPGEGGELPGHKVSLSIARTRHSTAGVGLISPPPHHDIYSIEDLKQLIYDLKCSNPRARVSVKLVSEVGVGVVAAGVAKAKSDHILISGHDGGTGAARWTSIRNAGGPWELGLAEAHQTLVLNNLRGLVVLQTDGNIRTGRDVVMACLLGAEEFGFSTAPLIGLGCIMTRKCHLNTCPVGIATQDPDLRAKFSGQPEHVINFFYYIAQEVRSFMAKMGFRTIDEMVGRTERLKVNESLRTFKTENLDLSPLLKPAHEMRPNVATYKQKQQDHKLYTRIDNKFIDEADPALEKGLPVRIECVLSNTDRAVCTTLSNRVSKRYGETGLPKDTIHILATGSAGQSMGAFMANGITLELEGDANDYVGKGLSGGRIIVYPPRNSTFKAEENILIGNVCLYGATSGDCFFRGVAGERFAVRNSGANAVVEGIGDHGLEYMTGGRVVVLGSTGRNFAAGMSGGIAYVLDMSQTFASKVNMEMVELVGVNDPYEIAFLRGLIEEHRFLTGSDVAKTVIKNFNKLLPRFVKVYPLDYKRVVEADRAKAMEEKKGRDNTIGGATWDHEGGGAHVNTSGNVEVPESKQAKHEPPVLDMEDTAADPSKPTKPQKLDKTKGFMLYKRQGEAYRNPRKRVKDWKEISARLTEDSLKVQAARCMDCGVPFCQSDTGCPISNIIPKWNQLVFDGQWLDALRRLEMTNPFPEFTGRVCPAPCEGACVLGINEAPVGIKSIECAIIDRGFEEGWVVPRVPQHRSGKKIAIVGSGPAGLAAAEALNRAGHLVTIYERSDRAGGLLQYGIPNMKLDKRIVQRRIDHLAAEGIEFVCNAHVGVDIDVADLRKEYNSLILATGSTQPRDLPIHNRNLNGIYYAMDFLHKNTKSLMDSNLEDGGFISAKGKHVVVIGGGDTGNDCIGTSVRHGAKSVTNFELLPQPPATRARDNPWPTWPRIFRVDYGHVEVASHFGKDPREYCIKSSSFISDGEGNVKGIETCRVEWTKARDGSWSMRDVPGSDQFYPADIVLLALGFTGPESACIDQLGVKTEPRINTVSTVAKGSYRTTMDDVYVCGDARRGQSLIVWGIREGRECAREIDLALSKSTVLPVTGGIRRRQEHPLSQKSNRGSNEVQVAA